MASVDSKGHSHLHGLGQQHGPQTLIWFQIAIQTTNTHMALMVT